MINLFTYMDYRQYLKDRYAEEKATKKHFSFRYFSKIAGFGSAGYLKMVMNGQRNLSASSINQFTRAFKLNKREAAYFEALVLFNQAWNDEERDLYFQRLSSLKPPANLQGIEKDQYEYFSQKHFVVIREMVALPNFCEDFKWIAQHVKPPIKPKEAEHAIEVLLHLGLLRREKGGKLVQSEASLTTPAEVHSMEVYNFHQAMLNEAKEAMLTVSPELRDITSLTIPVPKKSLAEVKERIKRFREEIIDFINKGEQNFHEVYQLNAQLFPVSSTNSEGGKK